MTDSYDLVLQTREEAAGAQTRGHLTLGRVRPTREFFVSSSILNHSHRGIITVMNIIKIHLCQILFSVLCGYL